MQNLFSALISRPVTERLRLTSSKDIKGKIIVMVMRQLLWRKKDYIYYANFASCTVDRYFW
jgi:hypothetical protein